MTREKVLHELLCDLFDGASLRRFVRLGVHGEAVERSLPGDKASCEEIAAAVIAELVRRGIVRDLWARLRGECPGRQVDIDRVAARWSDPALDVSVLPPTLPSESEKTTSALPAGGREQVDVAIAGDRADVAILIALREEWDVFWPIAGKPQGVKDPGSGRYLFSFDVANAVGRPYRCVALCVSDMGPGQATDATHVLLQTRPRTVVNIGIAAAIHDDLKLCDVVVADQVDDYLATVKAAARGKEGYAFELRGSVYKASYSLVQDVENLKYAHPEAYDAWHALCFAAMVERNEKIARARKSEQIREVPGLVRVHLASGPVLAAAEAFSRWVRTRDGLLKALEMEAAGMMLAAHQRSDPTSTLVLRGVSDFGDNRKAKTDRKSGGAFRYLAMFNATQLLWAILGRGMLPRHGATGSSHGGHEQGVTEVAITRTDPHGTTAALAATDRAVNPHEPMLMIHGNHQGRADVDLRRYVDRALEYHDMAIAQSDLFIEQQCRDATGRLIGSARDYLLAEIQAPGPRFILMLGDYGSGKTTQLNALFGHLARTMSLEGSRTAVFVRLAKWRRGTNIWECVMEHATQFGCIIDKADLWDHVRSGRVILLFDGFDEISDSRSEQDLAGRLHEIRALAGGRAKVVVTSRRHFFRSDAEIDGLLLASDRLPSQLKISPQLVYLDDFTEANVHYVIWSNLAAPHAEGLEAILRGDAELARIVHRPILLTMLINIFPRLSEQDRRLSRRSLIGGIYERYVLDWFAREMSRGVLTMDQRLDFCRHLAATLEERHCISVRESEIRTLMQELGIAGEPSAVVAASADVRTVALIVRDATGNYSFSHRSFAEYFHASAIATSLQLDLRRKLLSPSSLDARQLGEATAVFLQGMIAEFSNDEISRLVTLAVREVRPVISLNLARCLLGLAADQVLVAVSALVVEGPPASPCAKDIVWALGEIARTLDEAECRHSVLRYLRGTALASRAGAVSWSAAFAVGKITPAIDPLELLLEARQERWDDKEILDNLHDRAAVVAAVRYQRTGTQKWNNLASQLIDAATGLTCPESRYNAIWILGWAATAGVGACQSEQIRAALREVLRTEQVNYVHSNAVEALSKFQEASDLNTFLTIIQHEGVYYRSKMHAIDAVVLLDPVSSRRNLEPLLHSQINPSVAALIMTYLKDGMQ